MKSIWKMKKIKYPTLEENIKTDCLIIGGGLAGILTAYELAKTHKVVLVEKSRIGSGTTQKTTGKISALQGILYQDLISDYDVNFARAYFDSQQEMIKEYERIIKDEHIDCSFEKTDAYLFSRGDLTKLKKEFRAFKAMGVDATLVESSSELPIQFKSAIKLTNQAIFHPLKFIKGFKKDFTIYEHSEVLKIEGNIAKGANFTIEANHIIVATHYPIKDVPGGYFMKVYPSIAYTLSIPDDLNIKGAYIEDTESGLSYRNYKNNILVCGLDHRAGKSDSDEKLKELLKEANNITSKNYEYYWKNCDIMTLDRIPYIGPYSFFTKELYVITGFNKWGMANSMLAGKVISSYINKTAYEYSYIFSPMRLRVIKQIPGFLQNAYVNTKSILSAFLLKPSSKTLVKESASLSYVNGIKKSVYVDKSGIKHYAPAKCEHLKSFLIFNPNSMTWDCPCHGSSYTIDGEVISGPANED